MARWDTCSLCEQEYHGVVRCALGWACWKTYVGRPETDELRCLAMNVLGNGLDDADHYEDALSVKRPICLCCGALVHQKQHARHAGQSCEHV